MIRPRCTAARAAAWCRCKRGGRLRHLAENALEFPAREGAQRLGAYVSELADAGAERGHGHIVGRFEDGDEVVLPERPVSVLERCTGLLRHIAHGCRALGTILDVAQALLGEAAQHDISRHVMSSRIVGGSCSRAQSRSPGPPAANNTAF